MSEVPKSGEKLSIYLGERWEQVRSAREYRWPADREAAGAALLRSLMEDPLQFARLMRYLSRKVLVNRFVQNKRVVESLIADRFPDPPGPGSRRRGSRHASSRAGTTGEGLPPEGEGANLDTEVFAPEFAPTEELADWLLVDAVNTELWGKLIQYTETHPLAYMVTIFFSSLHNRVGPKPTTVEDPEAGEEGGERDEAGQQGQGRQPARAPKGAQHQLARVLDYLLDRSPSSVDAAQCYELLQTEFCQLLEEHSARKDGTKGGAAFVLRKLFPGHAWPVVDSRIRDKGLTLVRMDAAPVQPLFTWLYETIVNKIWSIEAIETWPAYGRVLHQLLLGPARKIPHSTGSSSPKVVSERDDMLHTALTAGWHSFFGNVPNAVDYLAYLHRHLESYPGIPVIWVLARWGEPRWMTTHPQDLADLDSMRRGRQRLDIQITRVNARAMKLLKRFLSRLVKEGR